MSRRHKKNYAAAERAEQKLSGSAPKSSTRHDHDEADFTLKRAHEVPKARKQPGAPKVPNLPAGKKGSVMIGRHELFGQLPGLPESAVPGRSALETLLGSTSVLEATIGKETLNFYENDMNREVESFFPPAQEDTGGPSRHYRRRVAQHFKWRDYVIPRLTTLHLAHKYDLKGKSPSSVGLCVCGNGRVLSVNLADWEGLTPRTLSICPCSPAAEQLLELGYFPCAPVRPSLAFNINMLEFISIHSLHVAPNSTAWAASMQQYWARRGLAVEYGETFRKRLAAALHWFLVLENCADVCVTQNIYRHAEQGRKRVREDDHGPEQRTKRQRVAPGLGDNTEYEDSPESTEEEQDARSKSKLRQAPGAKQHVDSTTGDGVASTSRAAARDGDRMATRRTRAEQRARVEDAEDDEDARSSASRPDAGFFSSDSEARSPPPTPTVPDNGPQPRAPLPEETRTRPSRYLRTRCPLCFGGERPILNFTQAHCIICIDANFQQKRRKSKATDADIVYAGTRFASWQETNTMEAEVERKRKVSRPRTRGTSARVDDAILDECEHAFTAAQEKMTKASKNYYADTGVMALLCRHDQVIYVVNMTTPGERQYFALTLIRKFMRELPADWHVGLLYDIACQLSRSIEKHGFLEEFADRFMFGVSTSGGRSGGG